MVNVSKKALKEKELNKLFDQFNSTVGKLHAKESQTFLRDFFGKEEQIMLAKRLAAILMLAQGYSRYKVADLLKISSSTASQFQTKLDEGAYDQLLSVLRGRKKLYVDLLETIDSVLHVGGIMPHYGQTHASEAFKKRQQKPFG